MMKKFKDLQKKKGKKGFSMIELIIVIAIMAILIALIGTQLIPYLEKSRTSKDLTTMDTCLTNLNTALATAQTMPAAAEWTGITNLPADVKAAYEEVAGEAYDEDPEIKAAFKSDNAGKGKNDVIFGVATAGKYGLDEGIVYVKVGDLLASSQYSGELVNGSIPTGTASGSTNSGGGA